MIVKFTILSTQRTGSTLLCTSLDSHPNIRCHSEVLLRNARSHDSYWKFYNGNVVTRILQSLACCSYARYIPAFLQYQILSPFLGQLFSDSPLSRPWKDLSQWNEPVEESLADDRAVGFKLMRDQIITNHSIRKFFKEESVRCIYLYRKDIFATYVSLEKAKQNNPLFPALRSSPTAVQEPPAKSKFLAASNRSVIPASPPSI